MRHLFFYSIILLITFSAEVSILFAQEEITDYKKKLELLQKEYDELNRELNREKKAEKSSVKNIGRLDSQISKKSQIIYQLNRGVKKAEGDISRLNREINTISFRLKGIKTEFAKQVVYLYKYNRQNELKTILSSSSINDFLLAVKYFRIVSDFEKRRMNSLTENVNLLNERQKSLNESLDEKSRLLGNENSSKKELNSKRVSRRRELSKIRRSKEVTLARIKKNEEDQKKIDDFIKQLTTSSSVDETFPSGVFGTLKGRLGLPVRGIITAHAGVNTHPVYKTKTINRGVDFSAPLGSSVRAVAVGRVTRIRWMPGFGTTVFIDHNDGFFTAYAHLNEVKINEGDLVSGGQAIGEVGDDGSWDGAKLTFFIYQNGESLNPEEWLRK